tara:strand:- start:144 stop:332 length:189 start_codon:yes stop_codon:yes gene_type:complete
MEITGFAGLAGTSGSLTLVSSPYLEQNSLHQQHLAILYHEKAQKYQILLSFLVNKLLAQFKA